MLFESNFFEPDSHIHNKLDYEFAMEEQYISSSGHNIHVLHLKHQGEFRGTIVHFHGNAKNVTSHITHIDWLPQHGYDVVMFDYAGYGKSEGRPSIALACQNGVDLLNYVKNEMDWSMKKIIIGQSLGATIACYSLSETKCSVDRLILDCPFPSFGKVVKHTLNKQGRSILSAIIPPLVSSPYTIEKHLPNVDCSDILISHGRHDDITPLKFGIEISKLRGGELVIGETHGHTEQFRDDKGDFREKVLSFLA